MDAIDDGIFELMMAYSKGERLLFIGIQNFAAGKSFMVFVIEPVIYVELVGGNI